MLPLAIQTVHAFEKHEYSVLKKQVSINLYENEADCSVFHFKINHNSIDFSSNLLIAEKINSYEKIYTIESLIYSVKLLLKSSRGPPYLML